MTLADWVGRMGRLGQLGRSARRDDDDLWRLVGGELGTGTSGGPRCGARGPAIVVPTPAALRRLLARARVHGVLGLALARLPELATVDGKLVDDVEQIRRAEIARSARVRRHTAFVVERLAVYGIPSTIVAGVDFADALHADPRQRPTSAVEILVAREHWRDAATVLLASGHIEPTATPARRLFPRAGVVGNHVLRSGDDAPIAVTLSWNLVADPRFRGHASVERVHLDDGGLGAPGRVVIAATLAAYRHRFDRLFLLTDLQRAAGMISSDDDLRALQRLADRTGTGVAVDAGLALVMRVLCDRSAEELRRRLFGTPSAAIPEAAVHDAARALGAGHSRLISPARLRLGRWLRHARPVDAARI